MSYSVSIYDADYTYKTRRKACYFCNEKVNNYKEEKCKCKRSDCELCSDDKPANIPICENCEPGYVYDKLNKSVIPLIKNGKIKKNGKNGK